MVAPSPPSPRPPGRHDLTSGCAGRVISHRVAEGARPHAVDHRGLVQAGQRGVVEVAVQHLERFLAPWRRAGRATTRPSGPARAGAVTPSRMSAAVSDREPGQSTAAPGRTASPSPPVAGSRSSTARLRRMPPASSVARRPLLSSAAIRPSVPAVRLRARIPMRQAIGTAAPVRSGFGLRSRQPVQLGLGPLEVLVEAPLGDGLAFEPAADPADLGPDVVDQPLGFVASRLDGLVAFAPGPATLVLGRGLRRFGPLLGHPGLERGLRPSPPAWP